MNSGTTDSYHLSGYTFNLTTNLDLSAYWWVPIGGHNTTMSVAGSKSYYFAGTFNGNGHSITGLYTAYDNYYSYPAYYDYVGLFGCTIGATIKNLIILGGEGSYGSLIGYDGWGNVVGATVVGQDYVGALVGYAEDTNVYNVGNYAIVIGNSTSTSSGNGGLIGYIRASSQSCTITRCYNAGYVHGGSAVGGLIGRIYIAGSHYVYVSHSYNQGQVSGASYIGGIVGTITSGTSSMIVYLLCCYNRGDVFTCTSNSGGCVAGGLIGGGVSSNNVYVYVYNCFSSGGVGYWGGLGSICVAGLLGDGYYGEFYFYNCYFYFENTYYCCDYYLNSGKVAYRAQGYSVSNSYGQSTWMGNNIASTTNCSYTDLSTYSNVASLIEASSNWNSIYDWEATQYYYGYYSVADGGSDDYYAYIWTYNISSLNSGYPALRWSFSPIFIRSYYTSNLTSFSIGNTGGTISVSYYSVETGEYTTDTGLSNSYIYPLICYRSVSASNTSNSGYALYGMYERAVSSSVINTYNLIDTDEGEDNYTYSFDAYWLNSNPATSWAGSISCNPMTELTYISSLFLYDVTYTVTVYKYYTNNFSSFNTLAGSNTVTISYTNSSGTSTSLSVSTSYSSRSATCLASTSVTLTATAGTGYVFYGWLASTPSSSTYTSTYSKSTSYSPTSSISSNLTWYALFIKVTSLSVYNYYTTDYTDLTCGDSGGLVYLSYTDSSNDTYSTDGEEGYEEKTVSTYFSGINCLYGATITLTANARSGYTFVGWYTTTSITSTTSTTSTSATLTITPTTTSYTRVALFVKNYTMTIYYTASGTSTPAITLSTTSGTLSATSISAGTTSKTITLTSPYSSTKITLSYTIGTTSYSWYYYNGTESSGVATTHIIDSGDTSTYGWTPTSNRTCYFKLYQLMTLTIAYTGEADDKTTAPTVTITQSGGSNFRGGDESYGSSTPNAISAEASASIYRYIYAKYGDSVDVTYTIGSTSSRTYYFSQTSSAPTTSSNVVEDGEELYASWTATTNTTIYLWLYERLTLTIYYRSYATNLPNVTFTSTNTATSSLTFSFKNSTTTFYTQTIYKIITSSATSVTVTLNSSYTYYYNRGTTSAAPTSGANTPTTSSNTMSSGSTGSFTWSSDNDKMYYIVLYQRYTISYNDNVSSATITVPSTQYKIHGTSIKLSSTTPTRTGYTFDGWNTASGGTGTAYAVSATYSSNASAIMYAQWTANNAAYYDSTGGYWYVTYGYMPQTKVTDSTLISNLEEEFSNGNETDNTYTMAGVELLEFIYDNEYYAYWAEMDTWYKVEPVKWRLEYSSSQTAGYTTTTATYAVTANIVYVGIYSSTSVEIDGSSSIGYPQVVEYSEVWFDLNNKMLKTRGETYTINGDDYESILCTIDGEYYICYSDGYWYQVTGDISTDTGYRTTSVTGFTSAISSWSLTSSTSYFSTITNPEVYYFSNTGVLSTAGDSATMLVSSLDEINSVNGSYAIEFSDLVSDILAYLGYTNTYFTRNLGSNLNNIKCGTEGGAVTQRLATNYNGVCFTVKFSQYACVS